MTTSRSSSIQTSLTRWPAEWERHSGTWLTWPHNAETWPADRNAVEHAYLEAIRHLVTGESVHLAVPSQDVLEDVQSALSRSGIKGPVHLHLIPTNDSWCRDYGPIFVRFGSGISGIDFRFNAWGGKYPPWDADDRAGSRMAEALSLPCLHSDLVMEGGALEGNGNGLLLTTEQCLLNEMRNPELGREEIEGELGRWLGVDDVLWLGKGISGDDTDGHIDNLARFVNEDTVLTLSEPDPRDPHHHPLADNAERLRAFRTRAGRPLRVVELPEPDPLIYQGTRLPASYCNFYIGNAVVLVPCYGGSRDALALAEISRWFPERRVVAIDSTVVVRGFGAWHCLTQQIPSAT